MEHITVFNTEIKQDKKAPFGSRVKSFIPDRDKEGFPLVAALANNEIVSLNSRLNVNTEVEPLYLNSSDGLRVYRRSLCFLLEMAVRKEWPERDLKISHSLGHTFYYHFDDRKQITDSELNLLKTTINDMVKEDLEIIPRLLSYKEAVEVVEKQNQPDTMLLLEHQHKNIITFNEFKGKLSLSHGPLVSRSGIIQWFDITSYKEGFLLHFPPASSPMRLGTHQDLPGLYNIYKEYKEWGKILGVESIGKLNNLITDRKKIGHFVQVAETLQEKKISQLAEKVLERKEDVKVVLIAGPSSSGKTTFTKKLSIALQVVGFKPVMVSLDDYYLPRDKVPRDEEGNPDFEALEALDVPLLNENLTELFQSGEAEFPVFNFKKGGRQEKGRTLKLEENSIILMEGIHGLNQGLTPEIPDKMKFKIYISALTQLNLDELNRIATTDNRIIRRMVRDHQFRGYSALTTLQMWPSVMRGERKNIFPHQNSADAVFNSALDYELAVLRVYAEPLLRSVKPTEREYSEACRLLQFLTCFTPLSSDHVPKHSLIREFIGNSGFKY